MKTRGLGIMAAASLMTMGALTGPMPPMTRPESPRLHVPFHIAQKSRRQRLRKAEKFKRWKNNEAGRRANAEERQRIRYSRSPEEQRFHAIVAKMANHERNLWARAGYPGLARKSVVDLQPYAAAAMRRLDGEIVTLI